MINVNELRIGNLAYKSLKSGNGRKLIARIGCSDFERIFEDTTSFNFEPIMLSTEFLEKTELEKDGILYQKGKFAIKPWIVGGEIEWVIFWGDKAILYEKNYPVHRLQNLYFDMSNEELKLSST